MPEPLSGTDLAFPATWSEQDRSLYNKLDFYLTKMSVKRRKLFPVYSRLTGKTPWSANMGDLMRAVRKEPSPHKRQFFVPQLLSAPAKYDLIAVGETKADERLRHHKFQSPQMNFLPDFRDFLTDHVDRCSQDIDEKIMRADDLYQRSYMFYKSPRVIIPGRTDGELVASPTGFAEAPLKDAAWLQNRFADAYTGAGHLDFKAAIRAANYAENYQGVVPFSGGGIPGQNEGYTGDKYVLVGSGELWSGFIDDAFVLNNKALDLDLVFGPFKGSLGSKITFLTDPLPLRFKADGTAVEPETREVNPDSIEYGQTIVNPDYANIATSPFEVAFLVGGDQAGYRSLTVGPPPEKFSGNGVPKDWGQLDWSGKIRTNRMMLIPTGDEAQPYDLNKYGEFLELIAHAVYGCVATQPRNVIPIIFRRRMPMSLAA